VQHSISMTTSAVSTSTDCTVHHHLPHLPLVALSELMQRPSMILYCTLKG
jgi:hypothetical protein